MRLVVVLMLFLASVASAQTARPEASWAYLGAGPTTAETGGLVGVSLGIVTPTGLGPLVFIVGSTGSSSLFGSGDEVFEGHVGVGLSGGGGPQGGPLHTTLVVGPSVGRVALVQYDEIGRRRKTARFLPGVYAGAQGVVALGRSVGIGVEVYGQANVDLSTVGVRFLLAAGSF